MDNSKLTAALDALRKSGMTVYKTDNLPECEVIPTGSLICNKVMNGGVHTRRIEQIFSKPGVGKSVLAYTIIDNALRKFPDSIAILLDVECRFDPIWASKFIKEDVIERLIVLREEFIENAGNSVNKVIKQLNGTHVSCIVVDSIAAANTARYKDADMEKQEVGGSAMGVGKFIRAIVQICEKNNTAAVILNQLRDDIGTYGPSIGHTPGGTALKHAVDAEYYLRALSQKDLKELATSSIEEKTELGESQQVAVGVAIKCMKGKNWSQSAKTVFYRRATEENNAGYDVFNEILRLALATNVIKKPSEYSTTFIYPGFPYDEKKKENCIVDRKNLFNFLKNNKEVFEQIKQEVMQNGAVEDSVKNENFVEEY